VQQSNVVQLPQLPSELFPTRIRSRAIGFVYSWSRLSAALSGLIIAYLLGIGVIAVFGFIAVAMVIVVVSIGGFGPRTRNLALETIAR
jgi:putative MFS transporter